MFKVQNAFSVRKLTVAAMFTALGIVFKVIEFNTPANVLKISFIALPTALAGALLGPVYAAGVGIAIDILGFFGYNPRGDAFFFGFTVTAALVGFCCGLILYKQPLSIWRTLLVVFMIAIPFNTLLNTYWLSFMKIVPYSVAIFPRLVKELILSPIYFAVMFSVQKFAMPTLSKMLNK